MIALTAISTIASIASTNSAAKAEANAINDRARMERDAYHLRSADRSREAARARGSAIANFAASGGDAFIGTDPVLDDQEKEYSYEQFNDRFNTRATVDSLNTSAKNTVKAAGQKNLGTILSAGKSMASSGVGDSWFSSGSSNLGRIGYSSGIVDSKSGRMVGGV
ncbi:hypothetical protein ABIE65_002028 [Constrictibacter sp. MBR-5]|jgi:hypothetical protein|uniref:hypothetical protein n=1 Tax=Constrictibacter sp. MBR-5 TaxID=3156467 RepID=UPI00339841BB